MENRKIKVGLDIAIAIISVALIVLRIIIKSDIFQAISFVLITCLFVTVVFSSMKYRNDERISMIHYKAGFIAFMLGTITVFVFNILQSRFGIDMSIQDILVNIVLIMYCIYSLSVILIKLKI